MLNRPDVKIAVVGATGAVGMECLDLLAARGVRPSSLRLFASPRSAGKFIAYGGAMLMVESLDKGCFAGVDVAIFSGGKDVSIGWGPAAVSEGAFVVDNSSAFRMDPRVPLVVPEINGAELEALAGPAIIANPNCSTIIALMAVTPLHRKVGVQRMVVSTYQSASGAGAAAMAELEQQARDYAEGKPFTTAIFGRPYLFNLFSHNSPVDADGYNQEETKMMQETRKIWRDDEVLITATCVRVPVLRAHSESINLTFREELSPAQAREILARAPGVRILDDPAANRFPEPIHASGVDEVLVGRIRADHSQPPGKGLNLFVAGDQLRKGAALNAIQIAERLATAKIAS